MQTNVTYPPKDDLVLRTPLVGVGTPLNPNRTIIPNIIGTVEADPKAGRKFDGDKEQFSLLPTGVLKPVLKVLGFGAKKYAKDNWKYVDNARERYFNAAMRHLTAWWEGEKKDPETGESHLAHTVCCLFFLLWLDNKENTE